MGKYLRKDDESEVNREVGGEVPLIYSTLPYRISGFSTPQNKDSYKTENRRATMPGNESSRK
jgi:TPP-dependent pyruvate/acetoin dehydrogenase alpha subunit